jgi:hypothetical protein
MRTLRLSSWRRQINALKLDPEIFEIVYSIR